MPARKLASAAAAASLAGLAVLGAAAPASAQVYPPAETGVISDGTVVAGQTVTVSVPAGSFTPGATVTVEIAALGISGTTVAAADGSASFSFTVPADAPLGTATAVFTGTGGAPVTVAFEVVATDVTQPAPDDTAAGGQDQQGSVLPRTGSDEVIPLTVAGVVLVGVGSGLVVAARRRRVTALPGGIA